MSLRDAPMHLSPAFNEAVISEECVLLYDYNKSLNLDLPYDQYSRLKIPDPWRVYAETEKRFRGERRAYATLWLPSTGVMYDEGCSFLQRVTAVISKF